MANHKQHTTFSSISGLVFGVLAWYPCGFPAVTCLLSGGLCSVGGMLPDIDIKTSRSYQDCMSITACITSMLVILRVNLAGVNAEMTAIIGALVFLLVKFGVGAVIQSFTVHRGLIHSIPFGILCGEILFLTSGGDMSSRVLKAAGLSLGFFSHLLLDEIYSVQVTQGKLSTKKSFGTALKFGLRRNMKLTAVLYFLLFVATYLSFNQPDLVGQSLDRTLDQVAELTIRGTQHFEEVSRNTQQKLRDNTNFGRVANGVTQPGETDASNQTLLAQGGGYSSETSTSRPRQYAMPTFASLPDDTALSAPFPAQTAAPVSAPIPVTAPAVVPVPVPTLAPVGQPAGGTAIASAPTTRGPVPRPLLWGETPSSGTTTPQIAAAHSITPIGTPVQRPLLINEIAPTSPGAASLLPPAAPIP